MYAAAIVFTVLMALISCLGAAFVPWFLVSAPQGGHEGILYAVGVFVTIPGFLSGIVAFSLLLALRNNEKYRNRLLARLFWLPLCPPILVLIALHVMLLLK